MVCVLHSMERCLDERLMVLKLSSLVALPKLDHCNQKWLQYPCTHNHPLETEHKTWAVMRTGWLPPPHNYNSLTPFTSKKCCLPRFTKAGNTWIRCPCSFGPYADPRVCNATDPSEKHPWTSALIMSRSPTWHRYLSNIKILLASGKKQEIDSAGRLLNNAHHSDSSYLVRHLHYDASEHHLGDARHLAVKLHRGGYLNLFSNVSLIFLSRDPKLRLPSPDNTGNEEVSRKWACP